MENSDPTFNIIKKYITHWINWKISDISQLAVGFRSNGYIFFLGELSPRAEKQIKYFLQDHSLITKRIKEGPEILCINENTFAIEKKIVLEFSNQGIFRCIITQSDWKKYNEKIEKEKSPKFHYSQLLDGFCRKDAIFYAAGTNILAGSLEYIDINPVALASALYYNGPNNSIAVLENRLIWEDGIEARRAEVRILDWYYSFLKEIFKDDKNQYLMFMDRLQIQKGGNELYTKFALSFEEIIALITKNAK